MDNTTLKENKIKIDIENVTIDNLKPKSPILGYTYSEFYKICIGYYEEFNQISKEINESSLSKETIIAVNSLTKEIVKYSKDLLVNSFIEEAKKIINLGLLICDYLQDILNTNNNPLIKKFPLSLKLMLLEILFDILFKYEKDYNSCEIKLEEILEIQIILKLPKLNISSTKFYMALLKFFFNNFDDAEKLAIEAKNILESKEAEDDKSKIDEDEENNMNDNEIKIDENKVTNKMSNILGFLGEIYRIKKKYHNSLSCYENAYYLNLGRYGEANSNTEFYKNQFDLIKEEFEKNNYLRKEDNDMTKKIMKDNFNENLNNYNNMDKQFILYKGKTDSFSFKIPNTSLNEPLYISIFSLGDSDLDRYSSDLFVSKLSFNKSKIFNFLNEKKIDNDIIYNDTNLKKILSNIKCMNGFVIFYDDKLKNALVA